MTIRVSGFSNRNYPVAVGDCAGDVIALDYFYDLPTAQNVTGDIIDIGILPAGHTVSDALLLPDDLDTNGTPTIALDVGIMSGNPGETGARTCGAEIFSGSTAAQAATVARPTLKSAFNILPTDLDRSIGVKIATQSATAAAGRIRLRLFVHPSDRNLQF